MAETTKRGLKILLVALLAVILIVGIIGFVTGGSGNEHSAVPESLNHTGNPDTNEPDNESNATDTSEEYSVGHTVTRGNISVSFIDVKETSESTYRTADDGNIYILPEFEIENNSNDEILVSTIVNFDVYADGESAALSIGALTEKDGEQLDGSIPAGEKLKGSLGYEVPADYKELIIMVRLDVWSEDNITFVYKK